MNWKKVAERLKELREEKGLSHEKLKKELEEKYKNIDMAISVASLKKYEVSEEEHRYAKSVCGMKTEYLYYFADFYGVSTDYILGLSDVKTKNETIQFVNKVTGLSTKAITYLGYYKTLKDDEKAVFLSHLIEDKGFNNMVKSIYSRSKFLAIEEEIEVNEETHYIWLDDFYKWETANVFNEIVEDFVHKRRVENGFYTKKG